MKISNETIKILNNFSTINNGIFVKSGKQLRTMSQSKSIVAECSVEEVFPVDFCFDSLRKFLGALSLYADPEIHFEEKCVTISSSKNSIKFYYVNPELIIRPPENGISLPSVDASFMITENDIKYIQKTGSLIGSDIISIVGDENGVVNISTKCETTNASANIVTSGNFSESFEAIFNIENLKIIPGDYEVNICNRGLIQFRSTTSDLTYYIGMKVTNR